MQTSVRISPAIVLLFGCSSSASRQATDPHQAERDAVEVQRKELEAAKPKSPLETRERLAYRASDRCGQGPYRIETDSLRARYAEQIIVSACGPHSISGSYRITVERHGRTAESRDRSFGFSRDNEACKGTRASVAQVGPSTGAGGTGSSRPGGTRTTSAAPPTTIKPATLERVAVVPEQCDGRSGILDTTYQSGGDTIALDAHVVIDVWSDEPNDLEGLVFVIEKKAVSADMTLERWKAFLAAESAWNVRYMAFLHGEVASGRTTLLDSTVKTPPPPAARTETPPPRPSRNARWIPGYWHYADASFHWIAGLWNVPDEDIAKDLTVHAPKPPPPAPVEQPQEQRPTATAVWTSGQWQWDGRAYVWITGAWRIPPSAQQTWRPAGWSLTVGGATFVPGGWHVRRRR